MVVSTISYTLGANLEYLNLAGTADLTGTGNGQNNVITGNTGNNTLYGMGGSDSIDGYLGADTMYGGLGDDGYSVEDAIGDKVIELAGQGTDSVYTWGDITYTLPNFVENLYLDVMGYGSGNGNALDNIIVGSIHDNIIDGLAGNDKMEGLWGDDLYFVDNVLDVVIEQAGQGNDTLLSKVDIFALADNVEVLSIDGGSAVYGTGNALANAIFGNSGDNVLDGGGDADVLSGLGGNDTIVFKAGQAQGDVVHEFNGNGAGAGDILKFVGYGAGAFLQQVNATDWIISSANGAIQETIMLVGAPTLDASDYMFV